LPYTHVLLDFDHTLLDTERSLVDAFGDALATIGVDPTDRYPIFDEINKALWRRVEVHELTPQDVHRTRWEQFRERFGLDVAPESLADAFEAAMGRHGELYPGALDVVVELAGSFTLAMVTNGIGSIQRARIARLDIERYFDAVTISAEVGVAKPSAAIFDLTFGALGDPDRAGILMVGDSLSSDIAGGHNAGIDTCWYNPTGIPLPDLLPGGRPPTHTISTLAELPTLLGR